MTRGCAKIYAFSVHGRFVFARVLLAKMPSQNGWGTAFPDRVPKSTPRGIIRYWEKGIPNFIFSLEPVGGRTTDMAVQHLLVKGPLTQGFAQDTVVQIAKTTKDCRGGAGNGYSPYSIWF